MVSASMATGKLTGLVHKMVSTLALHTPAHG